MDPARLHDRVLWGLNVAARATGVSTNAYRPNGADDPLAPANRFLRLPATFCSVHGVFTRTNAYGNALWHGLFDAAYTLPGDYLVQDEGIWFIASQQRLLPILCVRTDRVVSFNRPSTQSNAGVNSYGGVTAANTTPLMTNWPASVLTASGGARPLANLPSGSSVPYWTVLLPACAGVMVRPADLMSDDLGQNAVITTAELSDLGWRLTAKQVTT